MWKHAFLSTLGASGSQSLALVLPSLQSLPLIWPAALPQLEGLWKSSQPHPLFLGGETDQRDKLALVSCTFT